MTGKIRFDEINSVVPAKPGIYEIRTDMGTALKVGIADNLLKRLRQHRDSRQSCLRLKPGGKRCNPDDVVSKGSVLAKHLYYDRSITADYDLESEAGRRRFLVDKCHIVFEVTETKKVARQLEKPRERDGSFRYVNRISIR
jgi:hypothetical protein